MRERSGEKRREEKEWGVERARKVHRQPATHLNSWLHNHQIMYLLDIKKPANFSCHDYTSTKRCVTLLLVEHLTERERLHIYTFRSNASRKIKPLRPKLNYVPKYI